jgi:cellulose synthase/poly-beta-1,6-N-acetylglucosamine synthase-like glycosyltransferase
MTGLLGALLLVPAAAILVLSTFLAAEIFASFFARTPSPPPQGARGRIGVVIPAHNEQAGIAETVAAVKAQLLETDRVLVVADNCNDETAAKARPAGAIAIERSDAARCGKGYALQFGVDHMRGDPPATIVFIDADCRPAPGAIERIATRAAHLNRPVQALYLMEAPKGAGPKAAVSAFAWTLMNRVRMSGLQEIAGVTRLTGAGMAFPWGAIKDRNLASGEIVEDLGLTIAMIESGKAPFLDLSAIITSELAKSDAGATVQRARWEHGSIRMALAAAPKLLARGLFGDMKSLAMALDLATPPLTVFAATIVGALLVSAGFAVAGASAPLGVTLWAAAIFAIGIVSGWAAYGREILPPAMLGAIVPYVLGKSRVYGGEGRRSARKWTRTDRGDGP